MYQRLGNMLGIRCDAIVVTTNGYVKADGSCVMGRGIAKQIADALPTIPKVLGNMIALNGNVVNLLTNTVPSIVSFPVKPVTVTYNGTNVVEHMANKYQIGDTVMGWAAKADIAIIERSCEQLVELADKHPHWKTILVPKAGCGAGELEWSDVEPVMQKYLDDRFIVCDYGKPQYYAGIGSRETPEHIMELMTEMASMLERMGYVLRSGGAIGADTAFERGVRHNCNKQIFTPDNVEITQEAYDSVLKYHPKPSALKPYPFKLMARNYYQVMGYKQPEPVHFVLCWTPDGCTDHSQRTIRTGGTGQAISIASTNGIPVINMATEQGMSVVNKLLRK